MKRHTPKRRNLVHDAIAYATLRLLFFRKSLSIGEKRATRRYFSGFRFGFHKVISPVVSLHHLPLNIKNTIFEKFLTLSLQKYYITHQ